jgi:thiamine-phosphate diphosphorylase
MKPLTACHLYTFTDTAYLHGRDPLDLAKALCEGGSDLIQFSAKNWTEPQIKELVEAILPITKAAGAGLVVNDHLRIAQERGADFCHLGQEDFFDAGYQHIRELPTCAESRTRIGLSTHAPAQAMRALKAGADYIAVGPVYPTESEPGDRESASRLLASEKVSVVTISGTQVTFAPPKNEFPDHTRRTTPSSATEIWVASSHGLEHEQHDRGGAIHHDSAPDERVEWA